MRSEDSMWQPRKEREEDSNTAPIRESPAWNLSLGPGKQKEMKRICYRNIQLQVFSSHLFETLIRSMLPL